MIALRSCLKLFCLTAFVTSLPTDMLRRLEAVSERTFLYLYQVIIFPNLVYELLLFFSIV